MPRYALSTQTSLEAAIEHCTAVTAGLQAMPELEPLAAPWIDLRTRLRAARDARDTENDAVITANARVRVVDARWDGAVVGLSGAAFLAAGKNADASPYAPLFGAVRAADATKLGAAKGAAFGAQLVKKAKELNHAALASAVSQVEALNTALSVAAAARDEARDAMALNAIKRGKLVDELNALVATTEVGILTAFPGRKELTSAVLSPYKADKSRAADSDDDAISASTEA